MSPDDVAVCHIGSCQRHEGCMYVPCRAALQPPQGSVNPAEDVERHGLGPHATVLEDNEDGFKPIAVLAGSCAYIEQDGSLVVLSQTVASKLAALLSTPSGEASTRTCKHYLQVAASPSAPLDDTGETEEAAFRHWWDTERDKSDAPWHGYSNRHAFGAGYAVALSTSPVQAGQMDVERLVKEALSHCEHVERFAYDRSGVGPDASPHLLAAVTRQLISALSSPSHEVLKDE